MKKDILCFFTITLCCMMLISCCYKEENTAPLPDAVSIVVATDIHYLSPDLTDGGAYFMEAIANGDGKIVHYIDEITDAFFAELVESQPDYLILSGDLTLNGAAQSHIDFIGKLRQLQESGIQVLVIPGNHDVDSQYAVSFQDGGAQKTEALTSAEFAEIYHEFGPGQAISRDSASFSYCVQAAEDLRVILLDANSYGVGYLKGITLTWLERELQRAQEAGNQVITVSHQNLYAHNRQLSFGYQLYNADDLQKLLDEYEVLCHLSGHIHAQSIVNGSVPEIITSSLAVSPIQYGVLEYTEESLTYNVSQVDVAHWAETTGLQDPNLLDFSRYAEDYFADNCRRQVRGMLADSDLTEEEIELLAETFAELNQDYFAGRNPDYEKLKYGIGLWNEQENTFLLQYIKTIVGTNPNRTSITITKGFAYSEQRFEEHFSDFGAKYGLE